MGRLADYDFGPLMEAFRMDDAFAKQHVIDAMDEDGVKSAVDALGTIATARGLAKPKRIDDAAAKAILSALRLELSIREAA
jgi:DNA-binding phage protein